MRLKREHHEKSTLDRNHKRLKNVDSIKDAFIFVLRSQKSIFPDSPFFFDFGLFTGSGLALLWLLSLASGIRSCADCPFVGICKFFLYLDSLFFWFSSKNYAAMGICEKILISESLIIVIMIFFIFINDYLL